MDVCEAGLIQCTNTQDVRRCTCCGLMLCPTHMDKEHYLDADIALSVLLGIPNKQPFTVVFRKKNGDIRRLKCIVDRGEALDGGGSPPEGVFTVMTDQGFRSFNPGRILRINVP